MKDQQEQHPGRFEVRTTADSHFSWLRTRMSLERTLTSWVRTAVSLIGFGFTIVQFFDRLGDMDGVALATRPQAPRYLGLALIGTGILALAISMWQYRYVLNYIRSGQFKVLADIDETPIHTPVYLICIVLLLIGLFTFIAVLTRTI
jgi:putative membrane protein